MCDKLKTLLRNIFLTSATAGWILMLNGCSLRSNLTIWAMYPVLDGTIESLLAETDIEFARTGLEADLKLLEGLIRRRPVDRALLIFAAQGFTGYTMLYLDDEPDRARIFYERARHYGMRALELSVEGISEADAPLKTYNERISRLTKQDIAAAYWTASAWALRIDLERASTAALAESPRATGLMQWVLDREPHFYYSGPLWFFGFYYASLPPLLGGDPDLSRKYFEQAMHSDGDYFMWGKLLYAKSYAVQTLDKKLFVSLLEEVIAGAKDEPEDLRLINRVAALRAAELLKDIDQYF